MTDQREPKVLRALIYPLPNDPPLMAAPTDVEELTDAYLRSSGITYAPRDDTGTPAPIQYLSGMWKRRDGHNVQTVPPDRRMVSKNQPLDPWARRSPPARDV